MTRGTTHDEGHHMTKGTETMTLRVPGMSCAHCEAAVIAEVSKVAGVAHVQVDLATKDVTVTGHDLDATAIVAAIDEAGYEASG